MGNVLFKKFDYYWGFLLFTFILSFGFYLTHSSMGIDDEIMQAWIGPYAILSLNRIGMVITRFLQIWDYFPFWKEFLAVSAYTIGITLHAENFINYLNFDSFKFDKKMATIFACVAISFPFFTFLLCFMEICLINGLSVIFSALAVRSLYKYINKEQKIKYILSCAIFLFFILSCYEIGVLFFIISVCFIEFIGQIFNKNQTNIKSYKILSIALFSTILPIILCHFISFISRLILKVPYTNYEGHIGHDFSSIGNFFSTFINSLLTFIQNFLQTCSYDAGSNITLISYIIFLLIALFYSLKNKNIHIFIYGILIMLVPFAVLIITGNAEKSYRVYSTLGFVNSFAILFLYFIFKEHKIISKLILIFAGIIVFYQSLEINQILYTEYLKFENDRLFAYSLKQEVDKLGGKPLLLIGTRENPKLKYEYYIEAPNINISTFNWDRYDDFNGELFVNRPYAFMREQGFEVSSYVKEYLTINNDEDYNKFILNIKELSKNMTIYPMQGSVKDCGDFILIKIGESLLDNEEEPR